MENLDFVLWLILWPLSSSISRYIHFKMGYKMSERVEAAGNFISLIIWVAISMIIYQG